MTTQQDACRADWQNQATLFAIEDHQGESTDYDSTFTVH